MGLFRRSMKPYTFVFLLLAVIMTSSPSLAFDMSGLFEVLDLQVSAAGAVTQDYPFTTPANYDYNATLIEVTGGVSKLKAVGYPAQTGTWPLTTASNYQFTTSQIVVTGGVAKLNDTYYSDEKTWSYNTPANYAYDDSYLNVTDGEAKIDYSGGGSENKTWPFTTPSNYDYNSTEITVTGGEAILGGSMPESLEAYWKMDEGSWDGTPDEVVDSSGITNHGTAKNGTDTVAGGKIGRAGEFDGTDDNIEVPHDSTISFEISDSFSIQAWIKTPSAGSWQSILSKQQITGAYGINLQVIQTSGLLRMNLVGSGGSLAADTTNSVDDDAYHHIVITYDGTEDITGLHVYIDNNDETLATVANALAGSIVTSIPFRLGNREALNQPYDGLIDEVAIWSKELSSGEVEALYNSGSGLAISSIYYDNDPAIYGKVGLPINASLTAFTESSTKPADTAIQYQLSEDNGSSWDYWDGDGWEDSDESYSQSNSATDVNTNIGDYSDSGTITFRAHLHTTNTSLTPQLDSVFISYLWSSWYTTDVYNVTSLVCLTISYPLNSFVENTSTPASTFIQYHLSEDNGSTWEWYDGGSWTATDGTWTESNPASTINTNIATFSSSGNITFRSLLKTTDDQETPVVYDITINSLSSAYYLSVDPLIYAKVGLNLTHELSTFSETTTTPASTYIQYHMSYNNGSTWKWYNGTSWETTNNTFIESNNASYISTNIGTLSETGIVSFRAVLRTLDNTTTPQLSLVTVSSVSTLDYPISNPQIEVLQGLQLSNKSLDAFVETSTKPASTEIKYHMSEDNGSTWLWHDGASWTATNDTYIESNTDDQVTANISSLDANGIISIRGLLHTSDNASTPELDNIRIFSSGSNYVNMTKDFDVIEEFILTFTFQDSEFDWEGFGDDQALLSGINIHKNGDNLLDTALIDNNDLITYANKWNLIEDTDDNYVLTSTFSYPFGLDVRGETFGVLVQQDLSAIGISFTGSVIGYQYTGARMEIVEKTARHNSPLTLVFYDLEPNLRYRVNWTGNNDGEYFESNVEEEIQSLRIMLGRNLDNNVTIYLREYDTGELVDSQMIFFMTRDFTDFTALFTYLPQIAIFVIVVFTFMIVPLWIISRKKKK